MSDAWETLKAILKERLPDDQVQALMAELTIAIGNGAVAIGGDATGAIIITDSQNSVTIHQGIGSEELIKMLRSLLQEMQQVSLTPELSPEELREATLAFLQDIEHKFKETRLFHTKQPVILKDQYIPIQVTLEPHKRDVETVRGYWETEEELKRAYALRGGEEALKRQQVDWKEVKQKHQRIMVLADPGMGKTTLLRMEAGITAQQEWQTLQENETTIDQTILPLFLRLSELAKRSEELIDAIPLLIQRDYPKTAPAIRSLLSQKLAAGNCLLLLDALDEVPKIDRNRIELQEKLDRFVSNYACPVICTSRIVGYDGHFLTGGQEVEIVPFRERQIEQYVTTWFTNAADYISDESVSATELMRELRSKPQVRGLVQNPLLLSLICSLYQEKGLTLPARRVQVYEKAVEYMLEKWNQTRQSYFPGKSRAKQRLLEALAHHFSCQEAEVFDLDDLYDWMEAYLDAQAPRDLRDAGTEALIAELSEEDGILQKLNSSGDQFLFLHRTFQEYLTACYLERAKDGIELAKAHCWEYDWHETISLMAGLMKKPLPLLQAITNEKDDIFQTQLLLAGRCLAECEEHSHPLVAEIIDRIYRFWLTYPNLEFIRSVVVAVGQTHSPMCEQLHTALIHESSFIRRGAVAALERIGSNKAIVALNAALNDKDLDIRWEAKAALQKLDSNTVIDKGSFVKGKSGVAFNAGKDSSSDTMITWLSHQNSYTEQKQMEPLWQAGTDKNVNTLITVLNHEDAKIRAAAVETLGQLNDSKVADFLIKKLNDDEDSNVRKKAAAALGVIGSNDKTVSALSDALNNDDIATVRATAAAALGKIDSTKAIHALILALHDESKGVRWVAAEALGRLGNAKAIDALIAALNHEDARTVWLAAEALEKIGIPTLVKLIESSQINIYRSDIFSLSRSLAVRFSRVGSSFIPVYPERVAGIKDKK
ncbi:MAG: hypothetical protein Kow00121_09750 [Elainellaceae cyanobacterium]